MSKEKSKGLGGSMKKRFKSISKKKVLGILKKSKCKHNMLKRSNSFHSKSNNRIVKKCAGISRKGGKLVGSYR